MCKPVFYSLAQARNEPKSNRVYLSRFPIVRKRDGNYGDNDGDNIEVTIAIAMKVKITVTSTTVSGAIAIRDCNDSSKDPK